MDIRSRIDNLGGISAVSKALGHKYPTTVQWWFNKNRLPAWREPELASIEFAANSTPSAGKCQGGKRRGGK